MEPAEVDARLRALLDVGVTAVIGLQEADELGHDNRPFLSYHPRLQALGTERGRAVSWVRFPVRDMTAPSAATMRVVLDRIRAHGRVTYRALLGWARAYGRGGRVLASGAGGGSRALTVARSADWIHSRAPWPTSKKAPPSIAS